MTSKASIRKLTLKELLTEPVHFLAFGFGSGMAPFAPGTFGTLTAVPLVVALSYLSLPLYLVTCLLVSVAGIYICGRSADKLNSHDHPGIVWDEFAGFMLTMTGFALTWQNLLLGFIFFRIFDIVKPWPIKWADKKVEGGLGIMLDDLIAGAFAWLCLYGVNALWLG